MFDEAGRHDTGIVKEDEERAAVEIRVLFVLLNPAVVVVETSKRSFLPSKLRSNSLSLMPHPLESAAALAVRRRTSRSQLTSGHHHGGMVCRLP